MFSKKAWALILNWSEAPPVENDEPETDPYGDPYKRKEDHPQ